MRSAGFTLLEVLLATTVLGVVMAMLTLSLAATVRVLDATEQQEEVYFIAQTAMRRITEDLAATVGVADGIFVGEKKEVHDQRADSLQFTSLAHLVLNPEKQQPGVATLRYRVREDPDDARKLQLLRSDTPALPGFDPLEELTNTKETDPAFLLADSLRAVQFSYFDRDGREVESWRKQAVQGEGEQTAKLPAAVHCTLEFWIDPERELSQVFSTRIAVPVESQGER